MQYALDKPGVVTVLPGIIIGIWSVRRMIVWGVDTVMRAVRLGWSR